MPAELVPLRRGGVLYVDPADLVISGPIGATGEWEPHVSDVIEKLLTPETLFLDVGANLGYFTVLAARVARQVIAFEPVPANVQLLLGTVEANGFTNVEVWPVALSDRRALFGLYTENTNAGLAPLDMPLATKTIAYPGDRLLDGLSHEGPCLVKLDVEGHEERVLRGLERFLACQRPIVVLEYNPVTGTELPFVFERFARVGVILAPEVGEGVRFVDSPAEVEEEADRRTLALGTPYRVHVELLASSEPESEDAGSWSTLTVAGA